MLWNAWGGGGGTIFCPYNWMLCSRTRVQRLRSSAHNLMSSTQLALNSPRRSQCSPTRLQRLVTVFAPKIQHVQDYGSTELL
eukprot:555854-Amphidinium_carterae.1